MRLPPLRRGQFVALLSIALLMIIVTPMTLYLDLFSPFGKFWKYSDFQSIELNTPYGKARIEYDDYGNPTITAENMESLFYATGYVQAKDRLFQMDLQRRLMRGELS